MNIPTMLRVIRSGLLRQTFFAGWVPNDVITFRLQRSSYLVIQREGDLVVVYLPTNGQPVQTVRYEVGDAFNQKFEVADLESIIGLAILDYGDNPTYCLERVHAKLSGLGGKVGSKAPSPMTAF